VKKTQDSLVLKDLGVASRLCRGNPFQWPFYEMSAPPFNHYDPFG
jgi:hypothetical protein